MYSPTRETYFQFKKFRDYSWQNIISLINKYVNFKVAITEIYPRVSWILVADSFGFAEHALGNTGLYTFHHYAPASKFWKKTGSHSWLQQTKPALSLKIKEQAMLLGINIIGSVRTRVVLCLHITAFARACAAAACSNSRTHYFFSKPSKYLK